MRFDYKTVRQWDAVTSVITLAISVFQLWQGDTDVAIYWMLATILIHIPPTQKDFEE